MFQLWEFPDDELEPINLALDLPAENLPVQKAKRSQALPSGAKSFMTNWLLKHWMHPYMTHTERKEVAQAFNITEKQISVYLSNGRKRVLNRSRVAKTSPPPSIIPPISYPKWVPLILQPK